MLLNFRYTEVPGNTAFVSKRRMLDRVWTIRHLSVKNVSVWCWRQSKLVLRFRNYVLVFWYTTRVLILSLTQQLNIWIAHKVHVSCRSDEHYFSIIFADWPGFVFFVHQARTFSTNIYLWKMPWWENLDLPFSPYV